MGGMLLQAVRGMMGKTAIGQQEDTSGQSTSTSFDESACLKFTQDRWNDLKNAYIVYHQAIWETFLFYANQTWIEWEDSRKVWQPQQPTDEFVPQPRINRFSPTVDAVASNLYQVPEVEAVSNPLDDPEANMVACIASKLASYALISQGLKAQVGEMNDKAGLASQLFVLCGGLFSIIRVNKKKLGQSPKKSAQPAYSATCPTCDKVTQIPKSAGDAPQTCPDCGSPLEVEDSEMMTPQTGPDGSPVMEDQTEYEISCDIDNNLYAFPRPGATSIEDSPYLLWAKRRPLDDIWYRWQFEAQPDSIWPDGYSVTYEHALNFWYTGYSSSSVQVKDSCMTLEMFVSPQKVKDFDTGFHIVVINDKPAFSEEWDFPEHPMTLGGYLTLPTIFFPRSISFDLVQIQRELNAYESVIKLHAMTSAVDPIVIDANTMVSEITGRADKVIKWRPIGPNSEAPHRLQAGHLDDGVYKQRDNLHSEFQNISMAVNAFRGEQEGAITAASAIQQLRSQAELMFSKPVANWANFWKETIRKMVKFYQKYYTFEQIVKIVGPGKESEIQMFMRADLDTSTEWVSSQHGLPKTRDERRQEIMTLWDKGALDINQPTVRRVIYELFGGETGMMASFNLDATRARLENIAIKQGAVIKPRPAIEDLAIHLSFHKDQAKSLDFDKWPPPAQDNLTNHIAETTMMLQQQAQQAMMMQQGPQKPPNPAAGGKTPTQSQVQGQAGASASQGLPAGGGQ